MHSKSVLAEFIYTLDSQKSFRVGGSLWSNPLTGFLHDNSFPSRFMSELKKDMIISEGIDAVICILGDWDMSAEGIFFTDRAIYVCSPKNSRKKFKVRYDEISDLEYRGNTSYPTLCIYSTKGQFFVDHKLWSKRCIYNFLQFACEKYAFEETTKQDILDIKLESTAMVDVASIVAGITYGNVSNSASLYSDDKIVAPRGHGFAAEHVNHLADVYLGKDARIVGDDNAKNGADRIVNGVQIQSKYCASGSRCVQECFENGTFRYWNSDGSPMKIEVPSDIYDSALQAMESRIKRGEVPGVTDPGEAKNIICKGHFSYAQVKNIAQAGTVESLTYDAASGAIIARNAMGITVILTFANALWSGEEITVALKSAAMQGLKVGGTTFVTAVLAGQLSKAGLNSLLVSSSEALVQAIGPKASAVLINAFRSGTNIYGTAAMKSVAKLFRGNAITGMVSFAVLSIGDVANIFQGRISGGQLFKNLASTASTVAGGGAGWVAGAALGAGIGSAVPIIGTAAGGIIGGVLGALGGGTAASKVSGAVLDQFIEDDADQMVVIIQQEFTRLAEDYLITQKEAETIVELFQARLTGGTLKDMYASACRETYANSLLEDYFKDIASNRTFVTLPSEGQMQQGLKMILEEIADAEQISY